MTTLSSQITSLMIVYSIFCSGTDQRKHQSSASLAFVRGIHRWLVNFPHKGPVTWKMFPFDDVIMSTMCEPCAYYWNELFLDAQLLCLTERFSWWQLSITGRTWGNPHWGKSTRWFLELSSWWWKVMMSQITGNSTVCLTICWCAHQ